MKYNEKQLEIISVAETLFSDKGFAGTSVREIAEAAGINVAMISYYFSSKEKLMEAIFTARTTSITEKLETLLEDTTLEPFEKLEVLIEDYIHRMIDKHKFYRLMYFEQMLDNNPAINALLMQLKMRNGELLSRLIKDGQQKKVFKKNIDVSFMVHTMIGTIMHSFMNRENYRVVNNLTHLSDAEFLEHYKMKLTKYMKQLFKLMISNEA
ncbi:MAG: TetR/AcrR family transcriptional regulator [Chitinophagaceae bacterium]|nr:MAG: TetR/AcrR family transcriptional regulator [Chitinophagaceae bacterium]